MTVKLAHVIKFVADMDQAVAFHRDVLGLPLKFATPGWSELGTGETTLALHPASDKYPPGTVQLGFHVDDLNTLYADRDRLGLTFTSEPTRIQGIVHAQFLDSEGAENTIGSDA